MSRLLPVHPRVTKEKIAMAARKVLSFPSFLILLAALPQLLGAATVSLATSGTTSRFGSPAGLTATVTPASATGKVTFYDGATILGTAPIVAGQAQLSTIALPAGRRKLSAIYAGDGVNAAATSAAPTNSIQVVNAAAATHFAPPAVIMAAAGSSRLAVTADFDNDGLPDVAAVSGVDVKVLRGSGPVATTVADLTNASSAAVGDFNGDGKADLAIVNNGSFVNILLGNGDGTFQPAVKYTAPGPFFVAVGDFNGDGKADLAVSTTIGSISIFLGIGNGTFPAAAASFPGGGTSPVVVGDFNGDGKADLATLSGASGNLQILLGNGNGTFASPLFSAVRGTLAHSSLAVADLNGDGNADLAVTDTVTNTVVVLLGNNDGTFQSPLTNLVGNGAWSVAVLDLNADGKPDLAVANVFDNTVSVLLGNGDGTFQAAVNSPAVSPASLAVGDFNGDGKPDLLVTSATSGDVSYLLSSAVTVAVFSGTPQSAVIGSTFASTLQVLVQDGANPVSGALVTFTSPTTGASATSSGSATTNGSGVASIPVTANTVAGSYVVTATFEGLSVTFSLTNTPGPPANLTIPVSSSPQSAGVGTAFPNPLLVTVTDSGGNLLSGVTVTFAPPASGATAVLSSGTAVTNALGVASVTASANGTAGNYGVTASVGAISATFVLFNTTPQAGTLTATGGTPQSTLIGTAFTTPLQATLRDTVGNPLSGVTLNFTAPSGGATAVLSSASAVTNGAGVASITATAGNTLGTYLVTVSTGGVGTDGALVAFFTLTNSPGAPARVRPTGGTPQTALTGAAFAAALQATVTDAGGNLLSGITVTFTAPAAGASAALSSSSAVTNALGVASVTATANTIAGSYTVLATVGGISGSFSLSNAASAPTSLRASGGTPQSAAVGAPFALPLEASVKDVAGNPIQGVVLTFTAPVSGPSAVLSSTTAMTNAAGVGSVTAIANNTAGTYSILVGVVGLGVEGTLSASFTLTNTTAAAGSLTATGGTPQSAAINTPFANPLQVTLRGPGGQLLGGVTVTFTVPSSGASAGLSSATAMTDAFGVASVTATANNTVGSYLVTANANGLTASFSLTNSAFTVGLAVSGGTPQSTAINTAFANPLQVTVRDALGNTASGVLVTFTAPASGASAVLSSNTAMTNGSGIASVTATANNSVGNYVVTASAGGQTVQFLLTNTVTQVGLAPTGGTPQSAPVNTQFGSALQVTVRDPLGNTVGGVTVTFTVPNSGPSAILSSNTAVTSGAGIAFVTATANNVTGSYTVTANVGALTAQFLLTNTQAGASNLALNRPATQSSTLPGFASAAAGAAVDGVTNGNFFTGSVTHTSQEASPWWQVDLGASAMVNTVTTWNRTDCCGDRLSDFWVFVSDTPFLPTDTPTTLQNRALTFAFHQTSAPNPSTAIAAGGFQGRYVRVQLTGTNYLSLAEVQVFGTYVSGPPSSGTNLAVNKPAAQSSTLSGFATAAASSAVDGNTNGGFFNGSVTHTNQEANAWWQVDLGNSSNITSVVIWNRLDCCSDRLSDYWVFVSNTPFLSTDTPATLQNRAGTLALHQTSAPNPSTTLQFASFQGRYVRVQLNGTGYLSLAEVQVIGTPGSSAGSNLALGQTATESSAYPGSPAAGAAVDNNTDGNFSNGSVTHTNLDTNAWWQVDLGASSGIASVNVWNRTDCCSSRLGDFWIFVSDTPFGPADTPATLQNRAGTFSSHQTVAPNPSTNVPVGIIGRYVRVQLTGTNYLSLGEVQVISQ